MISLAIIPARGGSKRIPRKNIRLFSGRAMIGYAITAAQLCGVFDRIIVSSDDDEILGIAAKFGAHPLSRPAELAEDHTATVPVIAHAIDAAERRWSFTAKSVCCIYPAVPFLHHQDLQEANTLHKQNETRYVFPIVAFPSPVKRALHLGGHGVLRPLFPENIQTRTQDLREAYYDAGEFYWGSRDLWLSQKPIHANGIGMPIPSWRAVDIDTLDDWERAELLYEVLRNRALVR